MKKIGLLLIVIVVALHVVSAQNVGEVAPDFTLDDLSDQKYTLSENKGKVILVFLIGYNCSQCLGSAPSVKSKIVDAFADKDNFQTLVIDVWDGSKSGVDAFKNSTNINATYLQNGSKVASGWSSTKDRLIVIDTEGKMAFKGTKAAQSDVDAAKTAIQTALNNVSTSVEIVDDYKGFSLSQNYPNPALDKTTIEFSLGKASEVRLTVFDITGKKVLVPVQEFYPAGKYEVPIHKDQLKKGIYFYRMETNEFTSTQKMIFQ